MDSLIWGMQCIYIRFDELIMHIGITKGSFNIIGKEGRFDRFYISASTENI
jgi:hypothetical protein